MRHEVSREVEVRLNPDQLEEYVSLFLDTIGIDKTMDLLKFIQDRVPVIDVHYKGGVLNFRVRTISWSDGFQYLITFRRELS